MTISYPQWEQKEVVSSAPVLGSLAWVVGGHPKCIGCKKDLTLDSLPAYTALCSMCHGRVAQDSWACCEKVTMGEDLLCHTPLRSPPCQNPPHQVPSPAFINIPTCLEQFELIAMWFSPDKTRIFVISSVRAAATIAASGALVARRYQMTRRMAVLEDWIKVVHHLRDSHFLPSNRRFGFPNHQYVTEESMAALGLFADTPITKRETLQVEARREFFTPLDNLLYPLHVIPIAETLASQRYFLPRKVPRHQCLIEMPSGGGALAIIGTGVGAWGPWLLVRKLDGVIAQLNFSTVLGRYLTDSPDLLPALESLPADSFPGEIDLISVDHGIGMPGREDSLGNVGASAHSDGGE